MAKKTNAVIMDEIAPETGEILSERDKKTAISVKKVKFWPQEKNGESGYGIEYQDGYLSWCPKRVFDAAYLPVEDYTESEITDAVCKAVIVPNKVCASHFTQILKKWIDNGIIQK